MTSFVAVLAKNTHVCGCRPVLYYFKVNISLSERFIEPLMVIMDQCVLQPHYFLPRKSPFGGKSTSFVAVMAHNTCVYVRRLVLHHLNFNISSISRFMKPGMGIID